MAQPRPRGRPGLCSVTLRGLSPDAVIEHAAAAGLAAVEWAGDGHVPPRGAGHGHAARVGAATRAAGLAVASYGSYLFLGAPGRSGVGHEPEAVLATAAALGAPRLRVWAGDRGSAEASAELWADVVAAARDVGRRAAALGITVGLEFHGETLTDTAESTVRLLDEIDHPAVGSYWQPPVNLPEDAALAGLALLGERVVGVHAFSWWPDSRRRPLAYRERLWRRVADAVAQRGEVLDVLLEFVPDDDPAALRRDAELLRDLLRPPG